MDGERKKFHDMRFTEKLSHIWFYHKWHILCGLAFLVMILISLAQCMGKANRTSCFFTSVTGICL